MRQSLYSQFLNLLKCPGCGKGLRLHELEKRDFEIIEGVLSCSCGLWFPITNGIPRLLVPGPLRPDDEEFLTKWGAHLTREVKTMSPKSESSPDKQVQRTFGHKWTKQSWWGIEGKTAEFMDEWLLPRYGWLSREDHWEFLSDKKVCLDAGCGLGREALRMASLNTNALIIGLELSECVDEARRHAQEKEMGNVFFVQADINRPPFAVNSIDFTISEGVLHHTPDTKAAFVALVPLLAKDGEIGFYVYRKKAPLREYADDFIREQLAHLEPEEAWRALESLTKLGKSLADLQATVVIEEDVPLLGIKAGQYDIQRLIYYTMFKCFWNSRFSFDENVHVNYDWYTPRYAWRHTEDEVRSWLAEAGLSVAHECVEEAGITIRGKRVGG